MSVNDDWRDVRYAIFSFVLIAVFMAALVGLVMFDVMVLGNNVPENGATELTQEGLLALNALIFARLALLFPQRRGCFVLVMGLFSCMLIRELNGLFDVIQHGFWKYPAWLMALVCMFYAWRAKGTVLGPLAELVRTRHFSTLCYGMAIVLVFSRLFGNGEFWHVALADHFLRIAKNVAEEGIELQGYGILFCGSFGYYLHLIRKRA